MSLTDDEIAAKKEVFLIFDKQGDEKIDSADIGMVLRAMDKNPLEADIKKIQQELDPEGKKRISFQEFLPYLSRNLNAPGSAEEFIEGLRVFDKECNGFMPAAELRHVLTSLGEKLTDKQVDQLLAGIETDKDGNINYEEFVRVITSS